MPRRSEEDASYVARVVAFLRFAQPARTVANALLDLGLPRIRAWLREKAGPSADVGEIRIERDGALVHLDRVRVPLGARGLLALDHASATIVRGKNGLPEARLSQFEGALTFGEASEAFRAEVSFEASADADDEAWIGGVLTIAKATWTVNGRSARAMTGKARLVVSPAAWRLDDGVLETETDARVRFAGHGALDGSAPLAAARLVLETAKVGPFADALAAIGGQALTVPAFVPLDALLRGDLAWSAAEGGRCALTIASEAIDATIEGRVGADGGDLDGRIEADVRPAVPLRAANVSERALPRLEDRVRIEVDVSGRVDRPVARGTIRAPAIGFRLGRARFLPCPVVRAIDGTVDVEGNAARARLTAKVGQGSLAIELDGDLREPSDLGATATLDGLDGTFVREVLSALALPAVAPRELRLSAKLRGEGSAISGSMNAITPRSRVTIDPLHLAGRDPTGTRIVASLALDEIHAPLSGTLAIDLEGRADGDAPLFAGRFESSQVVLERDVLESLDGQVTIDLEATRIREARFQAFDGRWRGEATIPFGKVATYRSWVEDASAARVVARLDPTSKLPIPSDARIVGELHGTIGDARGPTAIADLALETSAGTALVFHGEIDATLDGSTLRGNVALADVLAASPFPKAPRPLAEGTVRIDAKLKGPPDAVVMMGYAFAPALRIALDDDPKSKVAPLVLTDASALFRSDEEKTIWHRGVAQLYGGFLTSAGVLGHGAFTGARGTIAIANVAASELPSEDGTLAPWVRGSLSGTMRFEQKSDRDPMRGRGHVQLDDAAFPFLSQSRAELKKYGLVPPSEEAIEPTTMNVELDDRGFAFHRIRAAVRGASASGDVRVNADGSLLGYLTVMLEEDYLRSSAILVLPRVLAERLTLPVRVKGTLTQPIIDADLAACLGKFLTENKVSSFFVSAVEEAAALFGAQPTSTVEARAETANVAPDEDDAIFAELFANSAEWDEIEMRLDDHRRSQIRYRVG